MKGIAVRALVARALGVVLMMGAVSACGGSQQGAGTYAEAAEAAWARAEKAYASGDWEIARSRYLEVSQNYPYSKYASLAEFRVADCHFAEGSYVRAAEGYRRFVRFHPSHEKVPEAEYRIAVSHWEQMPEEWWFMPPAWERDLTSAKEAHRTLRQFLTAYGSTPFAADARSKLRMVTSRLMGYELHVAEFYLKREKPKAAAVRCRYAISTYPEDPEVARAWFLYARAMLQLGDREEAVRSLRLLSTEHGGTEWGTRAGEYLREYGL